MKKKFKLFGMIALIAAIIFSFAACGDSGGGDDSGPAVPSVPQAFTAVPDNGQVELSWTAPASNGGSAIIRYEVSSDNGATWIDVSTATTYTFTGLTNDTSYTFKARAVNGIGNGAAATAVATPSATVPSVPQSFTAVPGIRQVALSWVAPASDGGSAIIKYEVSRDNGTAWVDASSATTHTFTGLTNGTSYTFKVRAVNGIGNGAAATQPATTTTPVPNLASWTMVTCGTFDSATSDSINGIAYGGSGKFVAVGNTMAGGSKMAYSTDDGTTWTAVASTTFTSYINGIAYGNDKFVAVGADGKMAHSTDGITWNAISATNSTFGASSDIYGIAYGGGTFVAGGQSGKMAYSANGINWTAVTTSQFGSDSIISITCGGTTFVAGGRYGKMAYSTDGTTWTGLTSSFASGSGDFVRVGYGGGTFIAVGNSDGMNTMAYSTDGITWTWSAAIYGAGFGGAVIYSVVYGGGRFIVAGYNGRMVYSNNMP